jgi:hypothetical protein
VDGPAIHAEGGVSLMRLRGTMLLAAMMIWAPGCDSGPSRDEARALVAASPLFRKDYTTRLAFGEQCDGMTIASSDANAYLREKHADYVLLATNGLLKLTDPYIVHPSWWWQNPPAICVKALEQISRETNREAAVMRTYYYWSAAVTEKGRMLRIPEGGGDVMIATKEIQQITELAKEEDGRLEARYRWRWAPSPVGEAAPQLVEALTTRSRQMFGTARLTRGDKGWQVVEVSDTSRYVVDDSAPDPGAPGRSEP